MPSLQGCFRPNNDCNSFFAGAAAAMTRERTPTRMPETRLAVSILRKGIHGTFGVVATLLIGFSLFVLLGVAFIVVMEYRGAPPSAYMNTGDH